jgi:protein-disulfide isomerase
MTLLQDDQNLASAEKVDSTPTFVINGEFYNGFQPDEMDKALRRIRAKG